MDWNTTQIEEKVATIKPKIFRSSGQSLNQQEYQQLNSILQRQFQLMILSVGIGGNGICSSNQGRNAVEECLNRLTEKMTGNFLENRTVLLTEIESGQWNQKVLEFLQHWWYAEKGRWQKVN